MKMKIRVIIPIVLMTIFTVYLVSKFSHENILHALSNKSSMTQEMRQDQTSLEITILEGQTFKQRKTINLIGKIKNVSDKTLMIREPTDGWTLGIYLKFKADSDFQKIEPNGFISTVGPSLVTLRPADEYTFSAVFPASLYSLPGIGDFQVYAAYRHVIPEEDESIWTGSVKSPITTISIVE